MLVSGEIVDVDSARLRTVCGRFAPIANACSRTVVSVVRSRMRTVCCRACLAWTGRVRGLFADMDNSRLRPVLGLFAPAELPRLWT